MTFNKFLINELSKKCDVDVDTTVFWNARFNRLRFIKKLGKEFTLKNLHSKQVTSICTPVWYNKTTELKNIVKLKAWIKKYSKLHKKEYSIDHIIPLRGEFVTGLNVSANLRIVVKCVNQAKSNKYECTEKATI